MYASQYIYGEYMHEREVVAVLGAQGFPVRFGKIVQRHGVRAFARAAELSEGVIRKYMNGESFPTLDRLEKIGIAAGVSLTWLATGEEPPVAGIEFDATSDRIEALARWLSVNIVALNIGLVAANPEFLPHQATVVPHILSDIAFTAFLGEVFDDISACELWDADIAKDKLIHDCVQDKLIDLYHRRIDGESLSPPRWLFALQTASGV